MRMPLLLLFALLLSTPAAGAATGPPPTVNQPAPAVCAAPVPAAPYAPTAGPIIAPSQVMTHHVFIPLLVAPPDTCAPIPGVEYGTVTIEHPVTDPPAAENPDLNLTLRGYELTTAYQGLIDGGGGDPNAPRLYTLFADGRVPSMPAVYQVYDWDWGNNCRGPLLTYPEVTLAGMGVTPGEVLHLPDSGYDIGQGYEALVLYATEERITLKYTREDHVVYGYTLHVEGVCVEPSLLALYNQWDAAGRSRLPALRGGQPFGRARGEEIQVAIRDTGMFMDPRTRGCWWQGK